jgi:hypothetical protein
VTDLRVTALVVGRGVVYAATGDATGATGFGAGVWRSDDQGQSWRPAVAGLDVAVTTPGLVNVAALATDAAADVYAGVYGFGLWRTTTGGLP